ncbi:MAG: hypothetical protein IH856_22300 [Deltaproteobacteria bacterium]|nr:hypothetical protein [Deltaproteobacteria bacterium]
MELLLCKVSESDDEVHLWLPRAIGAQFFKSSSVAALIASAASNRRLSVIDWTQTKNVSEINQRFGTTIEGLTSLIYSDHILNATKDAIDPDTSNIKWTIVQREGIAEPDARGASLTFCAFDETDAPSIPIAFISMDTKEKFSREFIKYRRKYFEAGVGEKYSEQIEPALFEHDVGGEKLQVARPSSDVDLAHFVFELFQNSLEHGCKDEKGRVVRGFRYITIRKHISHNKDEFISRAADFYELKRYLDSNISGNRTFSFYEISISDHGLGIIERFSVTRPDLDVECEGGEDQARLINRIMAHALSSKRAVSGAGHGLKRAMNAVKRLRGFVSLRTNNCWLYYTHNSSPSHAADVELFPVRESENLPRVAGTHVNMLFPLS